MNQAPQGCRSGATLQSGYLYTRLRRQIHSAVFWIVPLAVICVALTSFRGNPNGGIAAVCVGLAMLAIMPLSATRASAKNPGVLAPITYVFDDFGVSAIFFDGETRAQWSLVTGAFETARYVFVLMQRGSFHLIPKSQVDDASSPRCGAFSAASWAPRQAAFREVKVRVQKMHVVRLLPSAATRRIGPLRRQLRVSLAFESVRFY